MSDKCIECKVEVVYYYRSLFCEDCIKDFFEGDKDAAHKNNKVAI